MATFSRAEVIEHYRRSREELNRATEGLSDAQIEETATDGWSVKDHLVHVTVWDEVRRTEIERVSAGRNPAWPAAMTRAQIDAFNNLIVEVRRTLPLADVLAELAASRELLLKTIEEASERAFDQSHYGESGVKSDHESEHADLIRRWRAGRGP
jgi:hypothetical protein